VSVSGSGKTYFWFELAKNYGVVPIALIATSSLVRLWINLKIISASEGKKLQFFQRYIVYLMNVADHLSQQPEFQATTFVAYMLTEGSAYLAELYSNNKLYSAVHVVPDSKKFVLVVDEATTFSTCMVMETNSKSSVSGTVNALTLINRAARQYMPAIFAATKLSEADIANLELVSGTADSNGGATTIWYKPLPVLHASEVLTFLNKFIYFNPELECVQLASFILQGRMRYIELFLKEMYAELKSNNDRMTADTLVKRYYT